MESTPFFRKLNQPMLRFGKDVLTLRDFCEGTLVTGCTGAGKSSTSGAAYFQALLNLGAGGIILCAKPGEVEMVRRMTANAGREHDLVVLDSSCQERFNFLQYARQTIAKDFFQNLVTLMGVAAEAAKAAQVSQGKGENEFFNNAAKQMLLHAFAVLDAVEGKLNLKGVYRMVVSAPRTMEELHSEKWLKTSYCGELLVKLAQLSDAGNTRASEVIEEHAEYWSHEVPTLGDRTRASIISTLTNLIYPFLSGKLHTLFCTDSTFVPEMARQGKILCLDLPPLTHSHMGAAAQAIVKYLFGVAMQREAIGKKTRPVFLYADECQYFLSKSDSELLSTARSAKLAVVYITQDLPSFHAALGADGEDVAESIISKFGTRIYHSNSNKTNVYASESIGKMMRYNTNRNASWGSNSGGSLNQHEESGGSGAGDGRNQSYSEGVQSYRDFVIPPEYFAKELRTGAKKNRYFVDAILVRNGRNFKATGEHWMKVTYRQGEYG